jgi:hypothetical protein
MSRQFCICNADCIEGKRYEYLFHATAAKLSRKKRGSARLKTVARFKESTAAEP